MGGLSLAMLAPDGGRLGLGRFLPNRIRCTSLGIFCTVSLCVCRVCDRTLRPFPVGGPFPCQQRYSFNPARPSTARQPVKCPLYARAIDIFGAAPVGTATAPCHLPSSKNHEPGLRSLFSNQFTKRRIRTFITIPSARNMNNTEDPP